MRCPKLIAAYEESELQASSSVCFCLILDFSGLSLSSQPSESSEITMGESSKESYTTATSEESRGSASGDRSNESSETPVVPSFSGNFTPKKIIGVFKNDDGSFFKMQWNDTEATSLVRNEDAKALCPELVIAFYEQQLVVTP